jgi:hypothetical protein
MFAAIQTRTNHGEELENLKKIIGNTLFKQGSNRILLLS